MYGVDVLSPSYSTVHGCNLGKHSHKATKAKITKLPDFANRFKHPECDCSENCHCLLYRYMKLKPGFQVRFFCNWYSSKDSMFFVPFSVLLPKFCCVAGLGTAVGQPWCWAEWKKLTTKMCLFWCVRFFGMRSAVVFFPNSDQFSSVVHHTVISVQLQVQCRMVSWGICRERCLNWCSC